MAEFNGKHPTVWMKALRDHTYESRAVPEGSVYLAHEEMVETIEILGFAKREPPPAKARRPTRDA